MTEAGNVESEPVKLFGDPRSPLIERGPDRRTTEPRPHRDVLPWGPAAPGGEVFRGVDPGHAVRIGRGDGVATALAVLGVLVFGSTIVAGGLILYNAKNIGAFRNPWDSTRVAIGLAVLAVGIVQSAILVGLSRAISYLLAGLRLRTREAELAAAIRSFGPEPASLPDVRSTTLDPDN